MATDDVHVFPTGDLIEHVVDGGECLCGPGSTEAAARADGLTGWVITHHFDGREFAEPDYTGPVLPREPQMSRGRSPLS